jgi:hypothetical protein
MDDFVAGIQEGNGAIRLYYVLISLAKTIKINMAEWATNIEQLIAISKAECQEIQGTTEALGIDWNA